MNIIAYTKQKLQEVIFLSILLVSAFYYPNTKFVYGEGIPDFKAVKQSAYKLQAVLSSRK